MAMKIKIALRPLEPYFFGGERIFKFDGSTLAAKSYFIESMRMPSQTTLFGTLRYLLLKNPKADFSPEEERIGKASFDFNSEDQSFGIIKSISPLYLADGGDSPDLFIRCPFDHMRIKHDKNGTDTVMTDYTPFSYDNNAIAGDVPCYPTDYKAKDEIEDGFLRLSNNSILRADEVFTDFVSVISRKNVDGGSAEEGFAKKKYYRLTYDRFFVFFAEIDDGHYDVLRSNVPVFLGQGKSAFSATITEESEPQFSFGPRDYNYAIALSDICVGNQETEKAMFDCCKFCVVTIRDQRNLITNANTKAGNNADSRRRYTKTPALMHLISAGSFFILKPERIGNFKGLVNNDHYKTAGFNNLYYSEVNK